MSLASDYKIFPGTNPNVTEVEIQAEIDKALAMLMAGDFEEITLDGPDDPPESTEGSRDD